MNLPPFAAPQEFKSGLTPPSEGKAVWFIFSNEALLVSDDKRSLLSHHDFSLKRSLYLGTLKDVAVYAGEVDAATVAPPGWVWEELRTLFHTLDEVAFALAGRAMQLLQWDRTSSYCGSCGEKTELCTHERCRKCPKCGSLAYPKISLVTMILVKREAKILLARGSHFPEKFYSVLAGYLDVGETLEQCVMREVQEEVGIRVKNVRYTQSQPWPFSYSMLTGFTCDWESGEIEIDTHEIEDAGWFDRSNLPEIPPPLSLAYPLIQAAL